MTTKSKVISMNTITYSQIQELVNQLPATKLPLAYNFLVDLAKKEVDVQSSQLDFMLLPLSERRRIMARQAEQLVAHYERTETERLSWQGGDFIDEY
ncbi:hypothetical protein A2V82_05025 [candidate division KSB1 bacterium RBG_16_48_16]|nr:MAG: hypothetical protein A2V82_05025 [candidate division KSB1 bacterium RBG_16_48_16]